jgi:hypothetical protein
MADALETDGAVGRSPASLRTLRSLYNGYEEKPMPRRLEDVAEEALELQLDDRAALAEKLLRSLEGISEAENERLWRAEAERRLLVSTSRQGGRGGDDA